MFRFAFILSVMTVAVHAQKKDFAIVIHGGAGVISKDMPDSIKGSYVKGLDEALRLGVTMLDKGSSSLDVVERVVRQLEDNPLFNAGRGAVYNEEGRQEMDASIMDGRTLHGGAVAGVSHIKNPITLARRVMEKTPHVLLSGEGAEKFGREQGVDFADSAYFYNARRYEQLQSAKERMRVKSDSHEKGTVGCVALDRKGNLAAATSTGGKTNKMKGRIGDSPILGAGNYADNRTCAVSGTGDGEQFIRNVIAYQVSARMAFQHLSLQESAAQTLAQLSKGDGGFIAVDSNGNIAMVFNSEGMFRGAADSGGRFEVKIWE